MLCLQGHCLLGSVVGEGVPQENEDEDDAGGRQRRAGDVKQPRCLGIFHGSIQVIQELLVPNLEAKGGGRQAEVRGSSGWRSIEKDRGQCRRRKERGSCQRKQEEETNRGQGTMVIRGGGRDAEVRRGDRTEASRGRRMRSGEERGQWPSEEKKMGRSRKRR